MTLIKWTIVGFISLASGLGWAQAGGPAEPRNVIQLSATGTVEVQQDWLSLTLTSVKEGVDANAVQSQLRQALDTAMAEVKKQALAGALEIRTGQFTLQPRYGRDGNGNSIGKITGWQGTAELILEGRDFARIGVAASRQQTMVISNSQFSLSREARSKVEAQAQSMGIDGFKAKALEIAQGFGFTGYQLREVSVNLGEQGFGMPRPRMMAMEARSVAGDAVPMEAGKALVTASVAGSVQLK